MPTPFPWCFDDGGATAAGYVPDFGDCVPRAISIVTGLPYSFVLADLRDRSAAAQRRAHSRRHPHPRSGVHRNVWEAYLTDLCWERVTTMQIGTGCRVHLAVDELPSTGRYLVQVSKHVTALVHGVIHDTYDPTRGGTRCVYGYYRQFGCDPFWPNDLTRAVDIADRAGCSPSSPLTPQQIVERLEARGHRGWTAGQISAAWCDLRRWSADHPGRLLTTLRTCST